jgi:hypothetical protein
MATDSDMLFDNDDSTLHGHRSHEEPMMWDCLLDSDDENQDSDSMLLDFNDQQEPGNNPDEETIFNDLEFDVDYINLVQETKLLTKYVSNTSKIIFILTFHSERQ